MVYIYAEREQKSVERLVRQPKFTTKNDLTNTTTMENTIKGRLLKFIESRSMSVRRFEMECGFPNAFVSNIKRTITPARLEALSNRFPELNIVWLMTGSGEMLTDQEPKRSQAESAEGCIAEMNRCLTTTFEEFIRHESLLNERYLDYINRLTEAYNHTLTMLNAERADVLNLLSQITLIQEHNNQIQQQNQQLIDMLKVLLTERLQKA